MADPFTLAMALGALGKGIGAISGNLDAKANESSLRQRRRGVILDAQNETERLRRQGRILTADQSQAFLKSGVRLDGTPGVVIEETKRLIQQEINAVNLRAQAEARSLRKARKASKRSRTFGLFGSALDIGSSLAGKT